jgi:dihydrolipoamide dehydrogenase
MGEMTARLLIIGGGPGGYTAAVRAGQLGCDTVLVEQARPGGTCLNIGCIPSKALIHVAEAFERAAKQAHASSFGLRVGAPTLDFARAIAWKDDIVSRLNAGVAALLKSSGVRTVQGHAELLDGKTCRVATDTGPQTIRAEHVLLATGSEPAELLALPFGGRIISSTEALSLPEVPARLAVVGAGYIGLEIGIAYAKLGAQVTVVEAADRILPSYDTDLTRPVLRRMESFGMTVLTGTEARISPPMVKPCWRHRRMVRNGRSRPIKSWSP